MIARDIMTVDPICVRETDLLEEVEERLFESDIRHIPVTRANGELVGILSDRDIREYSLSELSQTTAGEAMQGGVLMAYPDTELSELLELLLEHRIGAVPIVDPIEERLVGIVSYIDMLELLRDCIDDL